MHQSSSGASFVVTDFAPRFRQFGRMYRPPMIIRHVEPVDGMCRIRARLRPRMDYGRLRASPFRAATTFAT